MTAVRFAARDARASLVRTIALVDLEDGTQTGPVMDAMAERRLTECDAAAAAGVELTVPIAGTLLAMYLYHWEEGGSGAAMRLTSIVDPAKLPPAGPDRDLLHSLFGAARALAWFEPDDDEDVGEPSGLDMSAAIAARAFRRLARVLRAAGHADEALACAFSAVNLALQSDEAPPSAELAIEIAAAAGDDAAALPLRTRQAETLVRHCTNRPDLALKAFDAVESVVRHEAGSTQLVAHLARLVEDVPVLTGLRPLLNSAALPADDERDAARAARLFASGVWDADWEAIGPLTDAVAAFAIHVENARRALEPERGGHAETRWATWAFEYPPFQRAVPHGASIEREADLHELFLTVCHETIHVLSMASGLGRAVTAMRFALLEVEFRLWTFIGPADPESVTLTGVAPLDTGDLVALAQAEQALEISRKLQILQDVWGPWLEGLAIFGEVAATSADDPWNSVVTQVLANMMDTESVAETAARLRITIPDAFTQRQAEADAIYESAGRGQTAPRLRNMLADHPGKYLAGYLTVRSIVASWRRAHGALITPQLAFRVLLHVTRFGTEDGVPDLALPARDFREQAIARMTEWTNRLSRIPREDLEHFREPPAQVERFEWRGGRAVRLTDDTDGLDEQTLERFRTQLDRALLTLAEPFEDLGRVEDAHEETIALLQAAAKALPQQRFNLADPDADPGLIERMMGRTTIMPIGRVRCPFWLVPQASLLIVLLRTTDPAPGHGDPLHQLVALQLPAQVASDLRREMALRCDGRMLVTRFADIAEQQFVPEFRGGGLNYLALAYGSWFHIVPRGLSVDRTTPLAESLVEQARERILPDPLLDLESEHTSEGRAGALRTRRWLTEVTRWTFDEEEYDADQWAAHVRRLAESVLDRASHVEAQLASDALLAAVLGADAPDRLRGAGIGVLRSLDPTWIGEVAAVLAETSYGPAESPFLDAHADAVNDCLGPVFERGPGGWDVRRHPTLEE